jgi:hypothetical protein
MERSSTCDALRVSYPTPRYKCRKAPLESLKLAAVMPRNDSDTKGNRPRGVDQAGSSQPRSVWGTIVTSA